MEKQFSNSQAKQLIEKFETYLSKLQKLVDYNNDNKKRVAKATDEISANEVMEILKNVPIEEINRDKRKIRVKALRDAGVESIADVMKMTAYKLEGIDGISDKSAGIIKEVANELYQNAKKGVHLKLSLDDKNEKSTKVVNAISNYRKYAPMAKESEVILSRYKEEIETLISQLKPASGSIRWFLTSKANKETAVQAYEKLAVLQNGEFEKNTLSLIERTVSLGKTTDEEAWADFGKNSIAFTNALEELDLGTVGNDEAEVYGLSDELAKQIAEEEIHSEGLNCTLRNYQQWGVKYVLHQKRVLLGDEMGLGKTVQAIASMVSLANTGAKHFVVVAPASVMINWCREIKKFSTMDAIAIHGAGKKYALIHWIKNGGVAVTTFETTDVFAGLDPEFKIDMIVVDEAHYIKNDSAQRTRNAKALCAHAERLLFMSGTPLENRVNEMVALIDILNPSIAKEIKMISYMPTAQQFRDKISTVYYRRKREDVLTELPQKTESEEWCTLGAEEKADYEELLKSDSYMTARRLSWHMEDPTKSCKAIRLKELVEEAKEENRKVIVFSFFLDTIKKVCQILGEQCTEPINGSIAPEHRQEIIDEFEKDETKVVLPAQIQSGGTGLNIQIASVVIICEPQLKPSIESQAISRCYRMGQSRNVLVYRLLCENTIDESISELLKEKQKEFDAFADESAAAVSENHDIDEATLGKLVEQEIAKIKEEKANAPKKN